MSKKLTDNEAHELLVRATEALGIEEGESIHATTALDAARKSLLLLQFALVKATDNSNEAPKRPD